MELVLCSVWLCRRFYSGVRKRKEEDEGGRGYKAINWAALSEDVAKGA
jgi:hypothetical protein